MTYRLRHTEDAPPSPCVEQVFGRFVHREFPELVARVRRHKKANEGSVLGRAA